MIKNSVLKRFILLFSVIGVLVFIPVPLLVYADPMDPLNGINSSIIEETVPVGDAFLPNTPTQEVEDTVIESQNNKVYSAKDWEQDERNSRAVQLMDSIMLFVGVIGVALPTIYMGIYLGARIFPTLFLPIFNFIVKNKFNPEEQPVYIMFLRTLPVAVLGMYVATGQIKVVFKFIWNFVEAHFLH